MTERQALERAAMKFGKSAAIESKVRKFGRSSADMRSAASAELKDWRAKAPTIAELKDWPRETTIGEYLDALAAFRLERATWKARENELIFAATYYAFRILTVGKIFATVQGQGDSWEDALEKAGAI